MTNELDRHGPRFEIDFVNGSVRCSDLEYPWTVDDLIKLNAVIDLFKGAKTDE